MCFVLGVVLCVFTWMGVQYFAGDVDDEDEYGDYEEDDDEEELDGEEEDGEGEEDEGDDDDDEDDEVCACVYVCVCHRVKFRVQMRLCGVSLRDV